LWVKKIKKMMLIDKRAATKNLKIAFFIGVFPKISESWFIEQITALLDMGLNIDLFAFRQGKNEQISQKMKDYKLVDKTTYLEFPEKRISRLIRALPLVFRVLYFRPSALFEIFNIKKYGGGARSLKNLFWTAPLLGRIEKYQIIHCHFGMVANNFLIIRRILKLKQPFVTSIYGQDSSKYIKVKGINVYNDLKKECNYFLMLTEEMRQRFIRFGFPPEKLILFYGGVTVPNYAFQEKIYTPGTPFNIILVGRFVEKKGIDDALRAIRLVHDQVPEVRFYVVGDGSSVYREYLFALTKELKLESVVSFEGLLPHAETLRLYSRPDMHLMFQPSRTGSDGDTDDMPYVLVEGQLCGLPVVTTAHAGIREGLIDGVTGYVVPERDYRAAAGKILFLIKNPQLIKEMGHKGREFAENTFDFSKINSQLMELYKTLIKSS